MCTLVILRRPEAGWPLLLAANRDEMADRPWRPPGRHWPDRPEVVAGLDLLGGGSWLGLNDAGVAAAVLNRVGTLGPAEGKRNRGELVLEVLDHADAVAAAFALADLNPQAYRPFNLVVADNRDAFWLRHADASGREPIRVEPIPAGLSLLTARDLNDLDSPRIRFYQPLFAQAEPPDPDRNAWGAWQALLASRKGEPAAGTRGAMFIETAEGFGTRSSSLIALPAVERSGTAPVWLFTSGPPEQWDWQRVALD